MRRSHWVEVVFRPLVIAALLGCIALSLSDLLGLFFEISPLVLVAMCVLGSLEASISHRLLQPGRSMGGTNILRFRAVELATLFLVVKLSGFFGDSWDAVVAEVRYWPVDPLCFLDLGTIVTFVLALFSWMATVETANDLARIGEPHDTSRGYVPPLQSLTARFFWGGTVLMISVGVGNFHFVALDGGDLRVRGWVVNVLAYFLLGLVMMGQVRFSMLSLRWERDGVRVGGSVAGRWVRYGVAFVGLAALVAFLLPTRYTIGLLDMVSAGLRLVATVVLLVAQLVLLPFAWLLHLLTRNSRRPVSPPSLDDVLQLEARPGAPAVATPNWFEALRSLLFWAVALGATFYVVRSYLRDRPELFTVWRGRRPVRALLRFLAALWQRLRGFARTARERIPPLRLSLWRRDRVAPERPLGFFRLAASPRERILYYYLSILRRAGRQGVSRARSQTPYEYGATLGSHLPEAEEDVSALTQAFVEARYSRHPLGRDEDRRVRGVWRRVRAALQALQRQQAQPGQKGQEQPEGP
jgi:hypothetical protein